MTSFTLSSTLYSGQTQSVTAQYDQVADSTGEMSFTDGTLTFKVKATNTSGTTNV